MCTLGTLEDHKITNQLEYILSFMLAFSWLVLTLALKCLFFIKSSGKQVFPLKSGDLLATPQARLSQVSFANISLNLD